MNTGLILDFLNDLIANNNREWFNEHKDRYLAVHDEFVAISEEFIRRIGLFDEQALGVRAQDCIFRIYRDTRFSLDKTPYKNHLGVYVASHGGRKSLRGGYYLHLQPGASMMAAGVWCPEHEKNVLKELRQSIYDNVDELNEIFGNAKFRKYFTDFDKTYTLKKVPQGFPSDFERADWLKLKIFCIERPLSDKEVHSDKFWDILMGACQAAKPLNDFLNYTVDEVMGY